MLKHFRHGWSPYGQSLRTCLNVCDGSLRIDKVSVSVMFLQDLIALAKEIVRCQKGNLDGKEPAHQNKPTRIEPVVEYLTAEDMLRGTLADWNWGNI